MAAPQKIGVLTFHRCINYGSYWQARCLVEGFRKMGFEAALLDHDSCLVNRREWRCALQPQPRSKGLPGDIALYASKTRRFFEAFDKLPRSARFSLDDPCSLKEWDLIVVGSDEVWNLRHPWYGGYPIFYGAGLKTSRLVSYAASFGNYDASDGLPTRWAQDLANFTLISVRDQNSARVIRDALGFEPDLVLDPCLQFPPTVGPDLRETQSPYVVVYGHSFPLWFANIVRNWAVPLRYRLLSIGYRNDWADQQLIAAGPELFARLMAGAVAVVTNFFHGCVFSLLNAKPFACVSSDYRANKLRDLMRILAADRHLMDEALAGSNIVDLLGSPLDEVISRRLAVLRRLSHEYIQKMV